MATRQSQDGTNQQQQDQSAESGSGHSLAASSSPYELLSQHRDCTRLVRIEAAKRDDDTIICTLFEVAFRDRPKFDALSYMWGDGPARCNIILNGATFSVRQNLRDALHYLRSHTPDTSYWIDAICINQDDIPERNRQVRIMHHIYFRAQTVVVWLGKRYAEYEATLPDLQRLGHDKPSNEQVKPELPPDPPQTDFAAAQQRSLAEELYNDGYWNRLWIIQEIGRAREIKVCFGNAAVEWDQFTHFVTMHNIGPHGPMTLKRQREEKYTGSATLLQLLQAHRDALCQDSKDKVYGLVGMASDARGFVIDYKKSVSEIWTDVMEFMNRHGLFADKDIISVGHLVRDLLMGAECDPLQQILRRYAPGEGDNIIITNTNHFKAFKLQAAMLGCVICVGPRPYEIVGNLNAVDKWIEQVQANYRNDLGSAHKESDTMVRAILDLDDISLSQKCFDCRSIVQWSGGDDDFQKNKYGALFNHSGWIQDLQRKPNGLPENDNSFAEQQSSANKSRLFQMSDRGQAPWKMGLASSDIRAGDLVCWLEWPRRAVVVRPYYVRREWKLQVVGTAVVTADLGEPRLGCSQRSGWSENKSKLTLYLDARTIFILLAY
ncbi:heterokaryon incompatibility protein-domain-containing protein [Ilyonectria destructans]|nr:heterokaryon incompatibility protein-domain-containing protein [Ilyonectria destructans]